jgi:hypothetical protein
MNIRTLQRRGIGRANLPALPRLAHKAAHDLARPVKAVDDGLRAIEAWFTQHGDPFAPLTPAAFADAVHKHQEVLDRTSDTLSNAEILARLSSTFAALNARLQQAARED